MDIEQQLKEANAERLALDQLYIESLKNNLILRKQFILKESEFQEMKTKLSELTKELEEIKAKLIEKEDENILSKL